MQTASINTMQQNSPITRPLNNPTALDDNNGIVGKICRAMLYRGIIVSVTHYTNLPLNSR